MQQPVFTDDFSDVKYVGSKVIKISPTNLVDYNPLTNDQVKFHIPTSTGFLDMTRTYLRYNIQMSGRGHACPTSSAHSLWRQMRVLTGDSQSLETIDDYNSSVRLWYENSANQSIENTRDLFEGRSENKNVDNLLYYSAPPDWTTGEQTTDFTPKIVKVQHPVYTGIMSTKTFPVSLTGLRLEMNMDRVARSLRQKSTLFEQSSPLTTTAAKLGSTGATAADKDQKTAIGDAFTVDVDFADASRTSMELAIGDPLYIDVAATGSESLLGIITSFASSGGKLQVKYIPARATGVDLGTDYPIGSLVYYKKTDRVNGKVVSNVPSAQIALAASKISYNLSDMELVCMQIQPNDQYISAMTKAAGTQKGITIDVPTWSLYKSNLQAQDGVNDIIIPSTKKMCLSSLTVSLPTDTQDDITSDSFVSTLDGAQEFSWNYDGQLFPSRPLKLNAFLNGRNEPLAAEQIVQAVENAGYTFRDMLDLKDRFIFARSWTKENQIKDLSKGALSLRVEYSGATKQKLYNHFIKNIMRVNISSQGVQTFS